MSKWERDFKKIIYSIVLAIFFSENMPFKILPKANILKIFIKL
jgi:hypothetical protein